MKVGAVRDSNTVSTAIVRSIIFVNITFEFRGGTIGGKDVWLKAGGNMEYSLRDGVCRFVNFCGFYPAEM